MEIIYQPLLCNGGTHCDVPLDFRCLIF